MNKIQYQNYHKEITYCEACHQELPNENFRISNIRANGTAKFCKFCSWIDRHPEKLKFKDWPVDDIKRVIRFLINKEGCLVNDLLNIFDNKYSLDSMVELINYLKIANTPLKIALPCATCGKIHEVFISVYLKNKHFYCSSECYWKDKKNYTGKDSPSYRRVNTTYTNCGREINIPLHKFKMTNRFGENHNFCSQECYWQFRSNYYIKEKSSMYNHQYTPEQKEHLVSAVLQNAKKVNRNTSIQLSVNDILDDLNIRYTREYSVGYYSLDNYLSDYGLAIEVMGDYWHGNPLKYNKNRYCLNHIQCKTILKDKQKYSYLHNRDIPILYLWETDIKKSPSLCISLIQQCISNCGVLENYHSFNYVLIDDSLCLRDDLIIPYQNMKASEYKHLIKKSTNENPATITAV